MKRRQIIDWVPETHGTSTRAACRLLQFPSSTYYCKSRKDPRTEIRLRLKELAASPPRYGYRRLTILLQREGFAVGKRLVHRLYREESLQLRPRKRRRKLASQPRLELPPATQPNERWSMDFLADSFSIGSEELSWWPRPCDREARSTYSHHL